MTEKDLTNLKPSSMETFVMDRQKRKAEKMNSNLQYIKEQWEKQHFMSDSQKSYVVIYLTPYFEEDEKKRLNEFRKKLTKSNIYSTLVSGINVVLAAAYFKSFLKFSNFKKVLFGAGVFMTSHQLGTYNAKYDLRVYNTILLEKYEKEFMNKNYQKK